MYQPESNWVFKHRKVITLEDGKQHTQYRYTRGASHLDVTLETMNMFLSNPLEKTNESTDLGPIAFKKLKEELGINE